MNFFSLIVLLQLTVPLASAQPALSDDEIVNYAKGIDVHKLDKRLPSQRLDVWLDSGPAHLENLIWKVVPGCDFVYYPPDPPEDERLCVKFMFERSGPSQEIEGWGMVEVGTVGKGIAGRPKSGGVVAMRSIGGGVTSPDVSALPRLLNPPPLSDADMEVIRYTRAIDVQKLDSALPSQPLDEWLRSGPAQIEKLIWEVSRNCDLKDSFETPSPNELPLCTRVVFRRGDVGGLAMLTVGTLGKGPAGPPRVEYLFYFTIPDKPVKPQKRSADGRPDRSPRLSELPEALDRVSHDRQ